MKKSYKLLVTLPVLVLLFSRAAGRLPESPSELENLRQSFANPPDDSRILMRWWWFGPAVTKPELSRELSKMKEGGIGGVEVQPVYPLELDDPARELHNFPYLSDDFIDDLRFAADEAHRLGLRMDVTLGSGWPFGGPHIPVTQAAGALRIVVTNVPLGAHSVEIPSIGSGEQLIAAFLAPGQPKRFSAVGARQVGEIQNGRLLIREALAAPHVVLFFISSRSGMTVKRPAIGAEGFVLDHFDRDAIETHLHAVGDRLMEAFGTRAPYSVFSDSLEVYGSDWTARLLDEFHRRRGYELTPYLPALVGDIGPQTASVRHDWGRTLTQLIEECYLAPIQEWAKKHHTLFRSQTYGIPAVTLASNSLIDLPEGEGYDWRTFSYTRWATSASHLYGRKVTSAETWTWLHSPAFRATPLDMKVEADQFFLQGVNQIIGHGWPYSPESAGQPGWRFYAAAALSDHNPWWLAMPDVTRYLQRASFLLRQGEPANDVALLLPTDDAWAKFTPGHASVSDLMPELLGPRVIPQILDAGLNFDFTDAVSIAKIGIRHPVLVLPSLERIPLETYRLIEQYAQGGGIVVATHDVPSRAPGLREEQSDGPEIRAISERLFQSREARGHLVRDEGQLGALLAKLLTPDILRNPVAPELGFVHRKLGDADLYFLANTSNREINVRVTARSKRNVAEWWDPETGGTTALNDGPMIVVNFQPYESRFLVLSTRTSGAARPNAPVKRLDVRSEQLDWSQDWSLTFSGLSQTMELKSLDSWTDHESTRFYSGEAIYEKTVSVPASLFKRDQTLYLDFGKGTPVEPPVSRKVRNRAWLDSPVREAARVEVNGVSAGTVWRPPYEVQVTNVLHPGNNVLRITVGNLGVNKMAGEAQPDYRLLNLRYGQRFTPQDMENLRPEPSGLLKGVRLVTR